MAIANGWENLMKAHIKIAENGPYLITGGPILTKRTQVRNEEGEAVDWAKGSDLPTQEKCALCRCGQSTKKPFCDGTHKKVNFDGTCTADRAPGATRRKVYEGDGMTMTDDMSLCAGYEYCDRFGSVWKEIENSSDPQVKKRLEHEIALCPSGRLQYMVSGKKEPVEKPYPPTIAVVPDGPLWVLGGIPIEGPDGFTYEIQNRRLLCRCGQSKNKPFCDGMHWKIAFRAP
jgi:CDGSH-type Zn-finger protein